MKVTDMVLVSVDDHVVEPPDLFKGRLSAKYADLAPQFITKPDGTDVWTYNGETVSNVALNAVAGRPKKSMGSSRRRSPSSARARMTMTSV